MSFEYDLKPVLTSEWELLEAGSPHTIAARAIRHAKTKLNPSRWRSLVVVLERVEDEKPQPVENTAHTAHTAQTQEEPTA